MCVDGSSRSSALHRQIRRGSLHDITDDPLTFSSPPEPSLSARAHRDGRSRHRASSPGVSRQPTPHSIDRVPCPSVDHPMGSRDLIEPLAPPRGPRKSTPERRIAPSIFGDEVPTSPSRSDLAVSHGLAGFLRARVASVAARCRPWGSPRFSTSARPPTSTDTTLRSSRLRPATRRRRPRGATTPRRTSPCPSFPVAVSRLGLPPCAFDSPAAPTPSTTVADLRLRRSRVGLVRSEVLFRSSGRYPDIDRFQSTPSPSSLGFHLSPRSRHLRGVDTITPLDVSARPAPAAVRSPTIPSEEVLVRSARARVVPGMGLRSPPV